MAKETTQKQGGDPYEREGKTLASSVQRLRGWVGSDPSRTPELADALVQLTAHRLLGHRYAAAASDAQEAVRRAAELLTAEGPIGSYTSVTDAARYVTAVVHMGVIQAAVGLPEAAGRTIDSLQDLLQIRELRLEQHLEPQTAIWALSCIARAALASGDVSAANAYADAALARLAESGLPGDSDAAYFTMDVDLLASDCRWAARRGEDALSHLRAAQARYEDVVGGRLSEPARHSPALVERLAEPLFSLYRDMADRLAANGEVDLGLVTRRALVEMLHGLTGSLGDPVRIQLASALADLAGDLLAADRVDEADAAAGEAVATVSDWSGARSTRLLVTAIRARVLTRTGRGAEAVAMLRQLLPVKSTESPSAAHAVGLFALAEALQAGGDPQTALSTQRAFDDLARELGVPALEPTQARAAVQDLARGVVSRGTKSIIWEPVPSTPWYAPNKASTAGSGVVDVVVSLEVERRRQTAAWIEAERAEAHHAELERRDHARAEAERREAKRVAAERAAAAQLAADRAKAEQAKQAEAERRAAAEESERLERKRRREERIEAHRQEVERREAEQREAERVEAERRLAERLAADPIEAERLELERLEAELAQLERAEEET